LPKQLCLKAPVPLHCLYSYQTVKYCNVRFYNFIFLIIFIKIVKYQVFLFSLYFCAGWGHPVAFTKVLTMYQLYHCIYPSTTPLYIPTFLIPGTVSTGIILAFTYMWTHFLHCYQALTSTFINQLLNTHFFFLSGDTWSLRKVTQGSKHSPKLEETEANTSRAAWAVWLLQEEGKPKQGMNFTPRSGLTAGEADAR
jgi:hypothetical protein